MEDEPRVKLLGGNVELLVLKDELELELVVHVEEMELLVEEEKVILRLVVHKLKVLTLEDEFHGDEPVETVGDVHENELVVLCGDVHDDELAQMPDELEVVCIVRGEQLDVEEELPLVDQLLVRLNEELEALFHTDNIHEDEVEEA
jgi:hypothetical protein